MDLIKQYTSDSDSDEEQEEHAVSVSQLPGPTSVALPPPLAIDIYLQNFHNVGKSTPRTTIFPCIRWTPPAKTCIQIEQIQSRVMEEIPTLTKNYKFTLSHMDTSDDALGYHITLYPGIQVDSWKIDHFQEFFLNAFEMVKPPSDANILLQKFLRFHFKDRLRIGRMADQIFVMADLKTDPEMDSYFTEIENLMDGACQQLGTKPDYSVEDTRPKHITILIGKLKHKQFSDAEFERAAAAIKQINFADLVKDIDIDVDEIFISLKKGEYMTVSLFG